MTETSDTFWKGSLAPIQSLAMNIREGCSATLPQKELRQFAEHLRFTWHRSNVSGRAQQLEGAFASVANALLGQVDFFEAQMQRQEAASVVQINDLKQALLKVRNCKRVILPYYLLLVEDGDLCGDACAKSIEELRKFMIERYSHDASADPFLRKLSLLGLPAELACNCQAIRAAALDLSGDFGQGQVGAATLSSEAQERVAMIQERQQRAVDFLSVECSSSACKGAEGRGALVFSEKVGDLFSDLPKKFKAALSRGLFHDALAIFDRLPEWASLPLQAALNISSAQESMKDLSSGVCQMCGEEFSPFVRVRLSLRPVAAAWRGYVRMTMQLQHIESPAWFPWQAEGIARASFSYINGMGCCFL